MSIPRSGRSYRPEIDDTKPSRKDSNIDIKNLNKEIERIVNDYSQHNSYRVFKCLKNVLKLRIFFFLMKRNISSVSYMVRMTFISCFFVVVVSLKLFEY